MYNASSFIQHTERKEKSCWKDLEIFQDEQ